MRIEKLHIFVKDMDKSIEFYKKLLGMEPTDKAYDRWAQFDFEGRCIALCNNEFDRKK
jgi:Lactoylglutathione lyase and related lyases